MLMGASKDEVEEKGMMSSTDVNSTSSSDINDANEKTVDLVNSPEVQVMKQGGQDFIDIDIEHIGEGKVYRVEYEGNVYGVQKLSDGKIAFYEVVE